MIYIRYLRIVINYDIYSLFIDDISYDTSSPIDYKNSEDRRSSKNTHRSQQRSALHKGKAETKSQQQRPKVKQKHQPKPTAKRLGV